MRHVTKDTMATDQITNQEDMKSLLRIYMGSMPKGTYHRRDDDPCGLYRDGSKVFDITPPDHAASGLVGALVLLLNERNK